jgi:hypothetical protein
MNTATQAVESDHGLVFHGNDDLQLVPVNKTPAANVVPLPVADRGVTPADLLNIAMQSGDKDIDRLERLMQMDIRYRELQEQDRKRDAALAFEADFAKFKGENVIIPKTKLVERGKAGSFSQAEFDEVCRRLAPALSAHGFGFRHKQRFGSQQIVVNGSETLVPWVWVTCILSHRAGHVDEMVLDGPADDQSANTPIQNAQSAASYLKRQSLLAITGTATGGEDDEGRHTPGDGSEASTDPLAAAREAGHAAAKEGMTALTAWWGKLTARDRSALNRDFAAMRKAARATSGAAQ